MKSFLPILLVLLFINSIFGQNFKAKTELCVINVLGAKVYEKPNFKSNIITELKAGESLIIENIIQSNDQLEMDEEFSFTGDWIKPKNINGFVFSSNLSDKNVEIGKSYKGQTHINLLGKLIDQKEQEKLINTKDGEYHKYYKYKYYENGTYTYGAWDSCFDHITEYKNLTLNEVYHQMVSDYGALMKENEFWKPIFQEKVGNIIRFEGEGATENLKIEILDKKTIIVSSYDCT